MTIEEIYEKLDSLFADHRLTEVEPFLLFCLEEAKEKEDYGIYISVSNELIGFYRSVSDFQKAFDVSEDVLLLMEELQLEGTEHFATTLLNAATAYRAAEKQEIACRYYRQALQIYEQVLQPGDYRFASLYNNLGILLENMGEDAEAAESLEKALLIITPLDGAAMERAVTLANLALIYFKLDRNEEAMEKLLLSKSLFEEAGENTDPHYSAALSGLGEAAFRMGSYQEALAYYEQALSELQKHFGENMSYALLCDNCAIVCEKLGDMDKQAFYQEKAAFVRKKHEEA